MRVAVDTNVLVRAVVRDDPDQARAAAQVLTEAHLIAVALPCLCEFVWVLRRVYGFDASDVAQAIRALLAAKNVEVNRPAAEAGLSLPEQQIGLSALDYQLAMAAPRVVMTRALRDDQAETVDRKSTRLNSSHSTLSRMPSSA